MSAAVAEVAGKEAQLVAFRLAHEVYGVDISLINEIILWKEITHIPRAAPGIEGVINLRGKIVPILDLRKRLGLPPVSPTAATRIIVVEIAACTVGIVVDSVAGVLYIPENDIEPPSELVSRFDSDTVCGVGKTADMLVILLDMPKVLRLASQEGAGNG